MKEILFYKTKLGKSPIDDFLNSLNVKEVQISYLQNFIKN